MKRNSLKLLALSLAVVLATAGVSAAQGSTRHLREDRPARRETAAYVQANVLPVLRQQRQQLEAQLAPADRAQLATSRAQLQAVRTTSKALRQGLHPAGTSEAARPKLTEAQREQLHQLRAETRRIMLSVAQLAQKYDAPLQQLAREVQPQKEKWQADIKAIAEKNATPEQREHMAAHARHQHGHRGLSYFFRPAQFLLLDATGPAASPAERELGSTSFYPNPTTATSQLEYEVKKAGPVTIDLLDNNGTKLRTLLAETNQETGTRTQQLDLHDLSTGTYFYKITTRSGSETKRFVKE